jgi:hypothetical protein
MKISGRIIVAAIVLSFLMSVTSCRSSKSGCPTNFSVEASI